VSAVRSDEARIVAYDMSTSAYDLRLVCATCGDAGESAPGAPALYEGEEWGGPVPPCEVCGCQIDGLEEVAS
jgi:hypothetical protein